MALIYSTQGYRRSAKGEGAWVIVTAGLESILMGRDSAEILEGTSSIIPGSTQSFM